MKTATRTTPRSIAGLQLPAFTADAERRRLQFCAQATGQEDPVYADLQAARDAGYADLPVPPTFLFSLEREGADLSRLMRQLQNDMRQILYSEQCFVYCRVAGAGEDLHFAPRIVADYHKRDGALRSFVRETMVSCGGAPVTELRNVIVIRRKGLL